MTITIAISTRVNPAWEFLTFLIFSIFSSFAAIFTKCAHKITTFLANLMPMMVASA